MPKQKTHKGAAKRFKVTGTGKVIRNQAMHSHILTKKTTKSGSASCASPSRSRPLSPARSRGMLHQ